LLAAKVSIVRNVWRMEDLADIKHNNQSSFFVKNKLPSRGLRCDLSRTSGLGGHLFAVFIMKFIGLLGVENLVSFFWCLWYNCG